MYKVLRLVLPVIFPQMTLRTPNAHKMPLVVVGKSVQVVLVDVLVTHVPQFNAVVL